MRKNRIVSEFKASFLSFIRKKTTVFFTFFFPLLIIGISGVFIQTGGAGFFSRPQGFYISGYLSVVVLLTPLERIGSEVTRYRSSKRFEKLVTTPLTQFEWMIAHILVNTIVVGISSIIILIVLFIINTKILFSTFLIPFIILGVITFCGLGSIIGRVVKSQDGVTATGNAVGLPMLFLADTFITKKMLPPFLQLFIDFLPLTYFSRGVRAVAYPPVYIPFSEFIILFIFALVSFFMGSYLLPWKE